MIGLSFTAYGTVLRRFATADAIDRDRIAAEARWNNRPVIGSALPGRCPTPQRGTTLIIAERPLAMTLRGG